MKWTGLIRRIVWNQSLESNLGQMGTPAPLTRSLTIVFLSIKLVLLLEVLLLEKGPLTQCQEALHGTSLVPTTKKKI